MELHQLEAFSAVMSAGSVTGAGELLGRSQPAVTRQIQARSRSRLRAVRPARPRVTPTRRAFLLYEEVERSLVGLRAIEARARALGDESAEPCASPRHLRSRPRSCRPRSPRCRRRAGAPLPVAQRIGRACRARGVGRHGRCRCRHAADGARADVHWIAQTPCVAVLPAGDPLAAQRIAARPRAPPHRDGREPPPAAPADRCGLRGRAG